MLCANPAMCCTSFTSPSLLLPSSSVLVAHRPPAAALADCIRVPDVGLEGNTFAKYYKGLVIIPSLVPWIVLFLLKQDGALSHRNRNKWLEAWEREGRGKLLNRALVVNTLHEDLWPQPQHLIMLPFLYQESVCVYMEKTVGVWLLGWCFFFFLRTSVFRL